MYGQMTAGSWIYIGSQGIVQGTFETFAAAGGKHFGGSLDGKFVLTGGLGGMGGAQPVAAAVSCGGLRGGAGAAAGSGKGVEGAVGSERAHARSAGVQVW